VDDDDPLNIIIRLQIPIINIYNYNIAAKRLSSAPFSIKLATIGSFYCNTGNEWLLFVKHQLRLATFLCVIPTIIGHFCVPPAYPGIIGSFYYNTGYD